MRTEGLNRLPSCPGWKNAFRVRLQDTPYLSKLSIYYPSGASIGPPLRHVTQSEAFDWPNLFVALYSKTEHAILHVLLSFFGSTWKACNFKFVCDTSFYFWKTDRFWKLFLQTPKTRERLGSKQKVAFLDFLKNILATDLRCDNRSLMSAMGDRFLRKFLEKNV